MDFNFSEDQQSVRDLAATLFGDLCDDKQLRDAEQNGWFHERLWKELAQSELVGLAIPPEHGGSGMGLIEVCLLLEQQGRHVAPVPLWSTVVMGALPVARFGSAEQRSRILPEIAKGKLIVAAAYAEPGSDDLGQPGLEATKADGGWRLRGVKTAVAVAERAGVFLVSARGADGLPTVFLVDAAAPGLEREMQVATNGECLGELRFDGVEVGPGDVLGKPGGGAAVLSWSLARGRVGLCALELGVAQRQLELTAAYTTERQQFERPIATFQAVGQRAADAYIDVEAIRLSLWQAAWRLSEDLPSDREVAIAKFWAGEGGHRVAAASQHLHGGIGFDKGYPLYRYFLWAKQLELTLGSASYHLGQLGGWLAG